MYPKKIISEGESPLSRESPNIVSIAMRAPGGIDAALVISAEFGLIRNVEKLLEAGADPRYNDSEARDKAIAKGHTDVVDLLARYTYQNVTIDDLVEIVITGAVKSFDELLPRLLSSIGDNQIKYRDYVNTLANNILNPRGYTEDRGIARALFLSLISHIRLPEEEYKSQSTYILDNVLKSLDSQIIIPFLQKFGIFYKDKELSPLTLSQQYAIPYVFELLLRATGKDITYIQSRLIRDIAKFVLSFQAFSRPSHALSAKEQDECMRSIGGLPQLVQYLVDTADAKERNFLQFYIIAIVRGLTRLLIDVYGNQGSANLQDQKRISTFVHDISKAIRQITGILCNLYDSNKIDFRYSINFNFMRTTEPGSQCIAMPEFKAYPLNMLVGLYTGDSITDARIIRDTLGLARVPASDAYESNRHLFGPATIISDYGLVVLLNKILGLYRHNATPLPTNILVDAILADSSIPVLDLLYSQGAVSIPTQDLVLIYCVLFSDEAKRLGAGEQLIRYLISKDNLIELNRTSQNLTKIVIDTIRFTEHYSPRSDIQELILDTIKDIDSLVEIARTLGTISARQQLLFLRIAKLAREASIDITKVYGNFIGGQCSMALHAQVSKAIYITGGNIGYNAGIIKDLVLSGVDFRRISCDALVTEINAIHGTRIRCRNLFDLFKNLSYNIHAHQGEPHYSFLVDAKNIYEHIIDAEVELYERTLDKEKSDFGVVSVPVAITDKVYGWRMTKDARGRDALEYIAPPPNSTPSTEGQSHAQAKERPFEIVFTEEAEYSESNVRAREHAREAKPRGIELTFEHELEEQKRRQEELEKNRKISEEMQTEEDALHGKWTEDHIKRYNERLAIKEKKGEKRILEGEN